MGPHRPHTPWDPTLPGAWPDEMDATVDGQSAHSTPLRPRRGDVVLFNSLLLHRGQDQRFAKVGGTFDARDAHRSLVTLQYGASNNPFTAVHERCHAMRNALYNGELGSPGPCTSRAFLCRKDSSRAACVRSREQCFFDLVKARIRNESSTSGVATPRATPTATAARAGAASARQGDVGGAGGVTGGAASGGLESSRLSSPPALRREGASVPAGQVAGGCPRIALSGKAGSGAQSADGCRDRAEIELARACCGVALSVCCCC
jgi:hypothetical protein